MVDFCVLSFFSLTLTALIFSDKPTVHYPPSTKQQKDTVQRADEEKGKILAAEESDRHLSPTLMG